MSLHHRYYVNHAWLMAMWNSRTGEELRSAILSTSELILLLVSLLMGCAFGLVESDSSTVAMDSKSHTPCTLCPYGHRPSGSVCMPGNGLTNWADVIITCVDLIFLMACFAALVWELATLLILTPVPSTNIAGVVQANMM